MTSSDPHPLMSSIISSFGLKKSAPAAGFIYIYVIITSLKNIPPEAEIFKDFAITDFLRKSNLIASSCTWIQDII